MINLIYILVGIFSIALSDKFENIYNVSDILNGIISKYENNSSFRLNIDNGKIKTILDVDILWIEDEEYNRKTRIRFVEPLDFQGVHIWTWSGNNHKSKKWATKPGSGKKIDITNKKHTSKFDLSFIQLDNSILSSNPIISDTLMYNNVKCVVIDIFKKIRNREVGPIMKIWADPDEKKVYKIENYDYKRKKIINEVIFEAYQDGFPQLVKIKDIKKKNNLTVRVSDYKDSHIFEDLNIFNPVDIK